MTDTQKFPGWY